MEKLDKNVFIKIQFAIEWYVRQLSDENCKNLEWFCSQIASLGSLWCFSTSKKPKLEIVVDDSWAGFMQGKWDRF